MEHPRYGDLAALSDRTAGRCQLCHDDVDLGTYGLVHVHGGNAATVDHLHPQSFGGGDDAENLLLAHHGCNASRGNRDVEESRLALAGTARAPLSSGEKGVATVAITLGSDALAGHTFAHVDASGNRVFNERAAFWGGLFGLMLGATL